MVKLKDKRVEIDRIVIHSEYDEKSEIWKYLSSLKLKKISENEYKGFYTYMRIDKERKKIILDFYCKGILGNIVSRNTKFYGRAGLISINYGIKKILKDINELDLNCKVEQTTAMIKNQPILNSISIAFILTFAICVLIILLVRFLF